MRGVSYHRLRASHQQGEGGKRLCVFPEALQSLQKQQIINKQCFQRGYLAQIKPLTTDRLSSRAFSCAFQVSAVTVLHLPSPGPDTAAPGIPGSMVPPSLSDVLVWLLHYPKDIARLAPLASGKSIPPNPLTSQALFSLLFLQQQAGPSTNALRGEDLGLNSGSATS